MRSAEEADVDLWRRPTLSCVHGHGRGRPDSGRRSRDVMGQFETLPAWRRGLEVPPVLGTIADSQRRPGTAESDPKLLCLPDVDRVAPILLSGLPSLATYLPTWSSSPGPHGWARIGGRTTLFTIARISRPFKREQTKCRSLIEEQALCSRRSQPRSQPLPTRNLW